MAGRYRIGIDVGGTNTDAVILDERLDVVASVKRPTTADTGDGVAAGAERARGGGGPRAGGGGRGGRGGGGAGGMLGGGKQGGRW